jgi:hypothetical protein
MDTLYEANIFFYITTIAVVILTVLLAILLAYAIYIAKNVKEVSSRFIYTSQKIKEMSDTVSTDVGALSSRIRYEGGEIMDNIKDNVESFRSRAKFLPLLILIYRFFMRRR